jgi:prophage regulatory protein
LSENERVIRLPEVLKIIGLSRSAIYARIKKGLFPKQIKLGERAAGWFQSEVFAFVQSLAVVGGVA